MFILVQEVESLKKMREKYEKEVECLRHELERAEGAKSKCLYETEKVQVDMEKVCRYLVCSPLKGLSREMEGVCCYTYIFM